VHTESVAAAIKKSVTTNSRGGLGERPPKSRRRQPDDEVGIVHTERFVFQKNYLPRVRPSDDSDGEVDKGDGGQRAGVGRSR
jgi:hypothetical protein